MKEHNCPNCAAPIHDVECPYCGTLFIDFASMDIDRPFFIRFKYDGMVAEAKVRMQSINVFSEKYALPLQYDLHSPELYISKDPPCNISIDTKTSPMKDGTMLKFYRLE